MAGGTVSHLTPAEATLMMNREDALVLDVRETGEWGTGHITGALQEVRPVAFGPDGLGGDRDLEDGRESWMHVEIDRVVDEADAALIEESLQRVLRDVRESVEDWEKMRDRALGVVSELAADPPPLDQAEVTEGASLRLVTEMASAWSAERDPSEAVTMTS